jgi:hypothetical protein
MILYIKGCQTPSFIFLAGRPSQYKTKKMVSSVLDLSSSSYEFCKVSTLSGKE